MSAKTLIWIGILVGSTLGSLVPMLWGGDVLVSISSIVWSTIGGLLGIWGGYKLSQML